MDAERWQRIGEAFSGALDCPPEERHSFLVETCGNDSDLIQEIGRLIAEFEKSGDFLEHGISEPAQTLASGDFVAGRYRIEALLERGGMGEVYRAHDELMNEQIAIKTLRSELATNQELLRRFHREVQLARKVTHPNVCRVFDAGIYRQGDRPLLFFTMQLLDGETLAARIRRAGGMPFREALPLIRQMAAGLGAAHDAGVIHRDFKSANIILSGGRAVITDFGVARFDLRANAKGLRDAAAGTGTVGGSVAGTVAYMSPEQLCGEKVTATSDIYSFGVVLFEIATGRLPFEERNIIQSAMQRASDVQPDVRTLVPDADPRWAAAIARCLDRDPAQRFQSAHEIIEYLRAEPRAASRVRSWLRRRVVAAMAIVIIATLLSLRWAIPRFHYRNPRVGATILVTPAINETGDPRFSGLTVALASSIGQSSRFNLWDKRRLDPILQSMRRQPASSQEGGGAPLSAPQLSAKDWREIAFREGAEVVLYAALSRIGDGYSLTLRAEQVGAAPDPPMRVWNHAVAVESPGALFDAVQQASTWFRSAAGETPAELSAHNQLAQNITSSSWEALQLYTESERLQPDQAISFLRRAVDQDPHFAIAMMRLGDRLVSQRDTREGYGYWRRAIAEGRAQHLAEVERFSLETRYYIEIGDYAAAEPVLFEWSSKFPNDPRPASLLIPALLYEGKAKASADAGDACVRRFGPSVFAAGQMVHSLGMLRRLDEIPREIETIDRLGSHGIALRLHGLLAVAHGDYDGARRYFIQYRAQANGPEASSAMTLLAHADADSGDFAGAMDVLRDGLELDRQSGRRGLAAIKSSGLAFLEMESAHSAASREWALEAVSFEPSAEVISRSISILARLGFAADAKALFARIPPGEGPAFEGLVARSQAEMFLASRHFRLAIEYAEKGDRVADASQLERTARIFSAAGEKQRALESYRMFTTTPWTCWVYAEREWPGLCRSARLSNLN